MLKGGDIGTDLPTQPADENLVGQIDGVEAGVIRGWACSRGQDFKPLKVLIPSQQFKDPITACMYTLQQLWECRVKLIVLLYVKDLMTNVWTI